MKKLSSNPSLVLFMLAAFAAVMFLAPSSANARYHSKSDELPGLVNLTSLLILGGVIIAAIIIVKVAKKSSEDSAKEETVDDETESSTEDDSNSEDLPEEEQDAGVNSGPRKNNMSPPHLNFYLDIEHCDEGFERVEFTSDFSDIKVNVGLSFHF